MSSVFVIVNEWTTIDNSTGSEVVGSNYFPTEQDAWDHLAIIAEAHEVALGRTETSLQFEDHDPHLQYEEYYIQELTRVG